MAAEDKKVITLESLAGLVDVLKKDYIKTADAQQLIDAAVEESVEKAIEEDIDYATEDDVRHLFDDTESPSADAETQDGDGEPDDSF